MKLTQTPLTVAQIRDFHLFNTGNKIRGITRTAQISSGWISSGAEYGAIYYEDRKMVHRLSWIRKCGPLHSPVMLTHLCSIFRMRDNSHQSPEMWAKQDSEGPSTLHRLCHSIPDACAIAFPRTK